MGRHSLNHSRTQIIEIRQTVRCCHKTIYHFGIMRTIIDGMITCATVATTSTSSFSHSNINILFTLDFPYVGFQFFNHLSRSSYIFFTMFAYCLAFLTVRPRLVSCGTYSPLSYTPFRLRCFRVILAY